jgi:hypothetical protein
MVIEVKVDDSCFPWLLVSHYSSSIASPLNFIFAITNEYEIICLGEAGDLVGAHLVE